MLSANLFYKNMAGSTPCTYKPEIYSDRKSEMIRSIFWENLPIETHKGHLKADNGTCNWGVKMDLCDVTASDQRHSYAIDKLRSFEQIKS